MKMMKTHRAGIIDGFIVHHRIKLSRVDSEVAESIRAEIDGLPGVDEVRVDEKKKTLWIAYDASSTTWTKCSQLPSAREHDLQTAGGAECAWDGAGRSTRTSGITPTSILPAAANHRPLPITTGTHRSFSWGDEGSAQPPYIEK